MRAEFHGLINPKHPWDIPIRVLCTHGNIHVMALEETDIFIDTNTIVEMVYFFDGIFHGTCPDCGTIHEARYRE